MLALLFLPALLGAALLGNFFDDNDDDETASDDATPEEQIVKDGFVGTNAAESLKIDSEGGVIDAAGGNDTITGSETSDGIMGGNGNDVIFARGGDDDVIGGQGDDRVFLGDGEDFYGPTAVVKNSDAGNDFVRGGNGPDVIVDLLGSNELRGDLGNDLLISLDGVNSDGIYDKPAELGTTDTLFGGFGNDTLAGDDGDIMTGGAGSDMFLAVDDEDPEGVDRLKEVQITDFNTSEDSLMIINVNGSLNGDITLDYDAQLNAVRASYEGRSVALLQKLTAADIPNIQVAKTSLDGAFG